MGGLYSKIYYWVYPNKDYDKFLLQYCEWLNENTELDQFVNIYRKNAQQTQNNKK